MPFQLRNKWIFELFGVETLLRPDLPGRNLGRYLKSAHVLQNAFEIWLRDRAYVAARPQRRGVSMRGVCLPCGVAETKR